MKGGNTSDIRDLQGDGEAFERYIEIDGKQGSRGSKKMDPSDISGHLNRNPETSMSHPRIPIIADR